MKSLRRVTINTLLLVGALTTMATSLQDARIADQQELALQDATPAHFTLSMDAEIKPKSDTIDLTVEALSAGEADQVVRIVPDDSAIAMVEFSTADSVSHTFENLRDACPDQAPCSLGFTLELISGTGPLDLQLYATAFKQDEGGMCNKPPNEFSTTAVFTLTVDES